MRKLAVLAIGVVIASSVGVVESADWPGWRGPERDGWSASKGLNLDWSSSKPKLLWKAEGMGGGYASVSMNATTIFSTGNIDGGQSVIAVSRKDGSPVWAKQLTADQKGLKHGYKGSRCTPTLDGEFLYAVMSDGTLACLKQSNGDVVWTKSLKKDFKGRMMSS